MTIGERNGIQGLLKRKRKALWEKEKRLGEVPELLCFGCQDHVLNLMSSGSFLFFDITLLFFFFF